MDEIQQIAAALLEVERRNTSDGAFDSRLILPHLNLGTCFDYVGPEGGGMERRIELRVRVVLPLLLVMVRGMS
jgi:hypothetical protein